MFITFILLKQTVSRCVKTTQEVKKSFENVRKFHTPALQSAENQQKKRSNYFDQQAFWREI
jgi:hypothetical protein